MVHQTFANGKRPAAKKSLKVCGPSGLIDRDEMRIDVTIDVANLHVFVNQPGPEVQWIARRLARYLDATGHLGLGISRQIIVRLATDGLRDQIAWTAYRPAEGILALA